MKPDVLSDEEIDELWDELERFVKAMKKHMEFRIQQVKVEVIEEIEKNCKGYEDNTVRHLLTSTFWQYLKSKYIKEVINVRT